MRRAGIVAAFVILAAIVVAGLVVIALRGSVSEVVVVGLVSGVLGSSATAVATLLAVRWTMQGQRALDQEARTAAHRAEAVNRRRAAFRHLLVAGTHIHDAAMELRMYPKGRPSKDSNDEKNYDYALVSAALAAANTAHRAAEPDLILDLGPRAEPILKTYDDLRNNFYGYWGVASSSGRTAESMQEAFDRIEGSFEKLRAETHLELPRPGTEGSPEPRPLEGGE
jgi:hypothetical protein